MEPQILKWNDALDFGIAVLDDGHRELVDLYNRIVRACVTDPQISVVRERIRTFLMYARWHFEEEEERMRWCRYPQYMDHHTDHARLLQDAEDFVANLGHALEPEDSLAVVSYFKYWLTRHLASKDADFKAYLQTHDSGLTA